MMDNKKIRGFTLLEVLLYIGLVSIVIFSVSSFFTIMLQSRAKSKTISEVESQGARVIQIINQIVKNAEGINSPTIGNSATSLSIDAFGTANDPTIFDELSGVIRIKEGVGSEINLTSSLISASGLNFRNLSRTETYGNIQVRFTLTYINNGGRKEYDYSKNFYTSISLRQ